MKYFLHRKAQASQVALVVKNLPATAGDVRDVGSIPGLGRSPGEGHVNPLQYSCLENPMDGGAWWATVHRVAKSWTRLKQLSMHAEKPTSLLCLPLLLIYTFIYSLFSSFAVLIYQSFLINLFDDMIFFFFFWSVYPGRI